MDDGAHAAGQVDVIVVGSANLDLIASVPAIPAPGVTVLSNALQQQAGGKGLNQAVAAARSGARTMFLGAVGEDAAAQHLTAVAEQAGIDCSLLRRVPGPSGTAWISVQPNGENAIVVNPGANSLLTDLDENDVAAFARSRIVLSQLEIPLSTVQQAAAAVADLDARFVLNAAPVGDVPQSLLSQVDLLVVNEHEVRQLAGRDDLTEAAQHLQRHIEAVVVTLGGEGALIVDAAGSRRVAGVPARVVDTTGAGDTFTGALVSRLAGGDDVDGAVARAVVAGALAVEVAGAVPSIPTAQQIEERFGSLS